MSILVLIEHDNENVKTSSLNTITAAKKIDKKLSGLKWITPEFKDNPSEEIRLINQIKSKSKN